MLRKILTFLDGFIPTKAFSSQTRVRLRLVVIFYLAGTASLSVYLILAILLDFLDSSFIGLLAFALALNVLSIVLIKRSYPVDKVVLTNICMRLVITTVDSLMFSKTLFPSWTGVFTLNLLLIFLLFPERRIRLFMLAFTLGCQVTGLALAPRFGILHAGSFSFSPEGMISYFLFAEFAAISIIFFYLRIRETTAKELDQEQDDELAKVESALSDLLTVSQSFHWIYRAYRREDGLTAQVATILNQLQVLLSYLADKKGWSLSTGSKDLNIEIYGPLPAVMLLLFSSIKQVLESDQPEDIRRIEISVEREGDAMQWTVSWPRSPKVTWDPNFDWKNQSAQYELVEDLKRDCLATIDEFEEKGRRYLRISGPWLRDIG